MGIFRKHRKGTPAPCCAAVVPAAGSSTRMGQDKLFASLGGVPVLVHTLRALEGCPSIGEIIVVTRPDHLVEVGKLCREAALDKVSKVVSGGATRTDSVLAGVKAVGEGYSLIAIHDGARPLVSRDVVEKAIAAAQTGSAAAPAVPVKDTVKEAHNGLVTNTPDRSRLFAVQTPQVFDTDLIRTALTRALEDGVSLTDDCAAVERLGVPVALTEGSYTNLKITTPEDLAVAEALLEWEGRI